MLKTCPSSIQHWDSISQPLDYESPPLITRLYCLMRAVCSVAIVNKKYVKAVHSTFDPLKLELKVITVITA